jgi:2-C-methyl-D-erythritol 4-phosphate cytidylyltransferase
MIKNFGVILAGGSGVRVGAEIPKQMIKVAGKTILEHTVNLFDEQQEIDEVILLVTQGWSEKVSEILGPKYKKLSFILDGGKTRNETTWRLLKHLAQRKINDNDNLILHDAVRPLLDESVITNCIKTLETFDAIDVVIPSSDTIVKIDKNDIINEIPDRDFLRRGQTPQCFKYKVLKTAYENAKKDKNFYATDDCGVVLKYFEKAKIKCVYGSENNIKVTHPVDLFVADKLFQLNSRLSPKRTKDELKGIYKDKVLLIFGGSYGIGADISMFASEAGAKVIAHGRSTTGIDVSDFEKTKQAIDDAKKQFNKIDCVVITAGILKIDRLNNLDDKTIYNMVNINYVAPISIAKYSYKYLKESSGHLLFFTSSSYTRGRENYGLYSSSKSAIVNLTQSLAEEWANDGIKVNVINPERTATPMRKQAFGDEPKNTLLSSEKVALTSLDVMASKLTGQVIDVRR